MVKVKICGITNLSDAKKAAMLGASAIGFVFYKKSPRCISAYKVKKIVDALPPFVTPVGVFVNHKEGAVKDITRLTGIRTLQFHGDETPSYCDRFRSFNIIKAFRVSDQIKNDELKKYNVNAFLFDTFDKDNFGGSGKAFDWTLIKGVKNLGKPVILSGGLNGQNIKSAIEAVKPFAVDISSSIEQSPGVKDQRAMELLFDTINS